MLAHMHTFDASIQHKHMMVLFHGLQAASTEWPDTTTVPILKILCTALGPYTLL